jgi:hypothetical protein
MDVSEEAKSFVVAELQQQINDVKERMHDAIDSL